LKLERQISPSCVTYLAWYVWSRNICGS